jgi:hypothetical protein
MAAAVKPTTVQIGGSRARDADQRQSQIVTGSADSQAPNRRIGIPTEAIGMCEPMHAQHPIWAAGLDRGPAVCAAPE